MPEHTAESRPIIVPKGLVLAPLRLGYTFLVLSLRAGPIFGSTFTYMHVIRLSSSTSSFHNVSVYEGDFI
jgi:hypothetical protein